MHTNDPVLRNEINNLIDKYDLLNKTIPDTNDILKNDEFFTELDYLIEKRKNDRINNLKNDIQISEITIDSTNTLNVDFASLYPNMNFTIDAKFMAELKRTERKQKLKQINRLNEKND